MEKEKQALALYTDEEVETVPVVQNRWMWVRRFMACIILITLFMQSLAPIYLDTEEEIFVVNSEKKETSSKEKSHIVLHTGFPPTENVSGLTIYAGKSAATAFSPNPDSPDVRQIGLEHAKIRSGESWWDRLFPNRHVHLVSVQLPVASIQRNGTIVEATVSICASKKQSFGIGRPQVPDMEKCVETVGLKSDAEEADDLFSVLEWLPEVTIVLQKNKVYWLVVQTQNEPFKWVNAEAGLNRYGTAYETENGWEFKLDGEPIPSAMVMVENHHKDE